VDNIDREKGTDLGSNSKKASSIETRRGKLKTSNNIFHTMCVNPHDSLTVFIIFQMSSI